MRFNRFTDITPLPGVSGGTLQGWTEQRSDSAKHLQGHDQPESQSYSRNPWDCLALEAEEEQAFQDAEERPDAGTVDQLLVLAEREHNQSPNQGSDKDHSHRRTHRYSLRGHRDQSGWSHKLCAHSTAPEGDQRLQ